MTRADEEIMLQYIYDYGCQCPEKVLTELKTVALASPGILADELKNARDYHRQMQQQRAQLCRIAARQ